MTTDVDADSICIPSDNIVARVIEGELVIVPLVAGIGDADDELYTLNETGFAIWRQLDGHRTLGEVAATLTGDFDAPQADIEADVLGIASELVTRGILAVSG